MISIGQSYNRKTMNCAHFVAQFFNVPAPDDEAKFIRWMRKNFTPIEKAEEGCLIVVGPPLHVGVYTDWSVKHMQNEADGGQLVKVEMAIFKQTYKNIRFYRHGAD